MTRQRVGQCRGFEPRKEQQIFIFSKSSRPEVGLTQPSVKKEIGFFFFRDYTGRGVMSIHLHVAPKLRMSGAT